MQLNDADWLFALILRSVSSYVSLTAGPFFGTGNIGGVGGVGGFQPVGHLKCFCRSPSDFLHTHSLRIALYDVASVNTLVSKPYREAAGA